LTFTQTREGQLSFSDTVIDTVTDLANTKHVGNRQQDATLPS